MKANDSIALWFLGLLFTGLFVVIPLGVYLSGRKLKQPIVNFTTRFWRFDLFMLLFLLSLELAPLWIFGFSGVAPEMLKTRKQMIIGLIIGLVILALCGLLCAYLRLYWSYWQHDRNKSLTFYAEENLLRYWVNDEYTDYPFSEVVRRTVHTSKTAKISFDYTTLTFTNGTDILVTCMLCESSSLAQLLPNTESIYLRNWFPWLPKAKVL